MANTIRHATDPAPPVIGAIKDSRGKPASVIDPIKLHHRGDYSTIDADTLGRITDELRSSAMQDKLIRFARLLVVPGVFASGGLWFYGSFKPETDVDQFGAILAFGIQMLVTSGALVLILGIPRIFYAKKVAAVLLKHMRCPHCGQDLAGLSPNRNGRTVDCAGCDHSWLPPAERMDGNARSRQTGAADNPGN